MRRLNLSATLGRSHPAATFGPALGPSKSQTTKRKKRHRAARCGGILPQGCAASCRLRVGIVPKASRHRAARWTPTLRRAAVPYQARQPSFASGCGAASCRTRNRSAGAASYRKVRGIVPLVRCIVHLLRRHPRRRGGAAPVASCSLRSGPGGCSQHVAAIVAASSLRGGIHAPRGCPGLPRRLDSPASSRAKQRAAASCRREIPGPGAHGAEPSTISRATFTTEQPCPRQHFSRDIH